MPHAPMRHAPCPPCPCLPDGGTGTHNTRGGRHSLAHAAAEMEIAKGVAYLKRQNFARAIEVFRAFEKREQTLLDQAATNLSFLYFLEVRPRRLAARLGGRKLFGGNFTKPHHSQPFELVSTNRSIEIPAIVPAFIWNLHLGFVNLYFYALFESYIDMRSYVLNLSFALFFYRLIFHHMCIFAQGDYKAAEKHAEFAVRADRYNARALVNRANCLFMRGELEAAKEVCARLHFVCCLCFRPWFPLDWSALVMRFSLSLSIYLSQSIYLFI